MGTTWLSDRTPVGVGLRHVHYQDLLATPADLDFVEVHSENFFASGGASLAILDDVAKQYPVSLHGTSLGLGSVLGIQARHIESLARLAESVSPVLISDHAAFAWGQVDGQTHHGGDLLPIAFNEASLAVLTDNIQRVQERLDRGILVENLSAYLTPPGSNLTETEFFRALVKRSGCRLLVDLNNLAVNAINSAKDDVLADIQQWLDQIPAEYVGEIHLAGCTPPAHGELMIDDHSQRVSEVVWHAYHHAIGRFGQVPTLVEWDTQLPEWQVLLGEVDKARNIAAEALADRNARPVNALQGQSL
ncbi:MAG: DUF692 domain-containing protein [Endozoicomonas sp.]